MSCLLIKLLPSTFSHWSAGGIISERSSSVNSLSVVVSPKRTQAIALPSPASPKCISSFSFQGSIVGTVKAISRLLSRPSVVYSRRVELIGMSPPLNEAAASGLAISSSPPKSSKAISASSPNSSTSCSCA